MVARPEYILVVERELSVQSAIRDVIVPEPDFKLVAVCASKREALQVIKSMSLDIVLVGLHLVDGSGPDVVRAAKQFQPQCKVLVMGTTDDKEDIFSAMQAGAAGCLLKESSVRPERMRGNSIVSSLAFSRILSNLPAVDDARMRQMPQLSGLSPVQGDILRCVVGGLSNKEIARNLLMSSYNVDYHLRCLRKRFAVRNRAQLIRAMTSFFSADANHAV